MTTKYVSLEEVILLLHTNFPLAEEEVMLRNALKDIEYLPTLEIDTLQRYDWDDIWDWPEMIKEDTGEYIRYDDLKKLLLQ